MPAAAPHPESKELGHLLVGLMVLVAIMLIMLMVTAQSWTFLIRRDMEAELIFRGEQYAKAIDFYKKETNNYPLDLKVLGERGPHRHRFIRKLYKDPLSKDGKWGMLYLSPTGKGYVNPYATRRDQDAFAAGGLDQDIGDGQAVPLDADFSARRGRLRGGRLGGGRMGGRPGSSFGRTEDASRNPGYSELSAEDFAARGGEQLGMPIVGVVHKKKEAGLKIYKNQTNLNDWAFSVIDATQQYNLGGGQLPQVAPKRKFGIGDHTAPIRRAGEGGPPGIESPFWKLRQQNREKAAQAEADDKKRKAEEGGDDQDGGGAGADQDEQPPDDGGAEPDDAGGGQDPNAPHDPNAPAAPRDPNAPHDPNAPSSPNAP